LNTTPSYSISVLIPALNEQVGIKRTISAIPSKKLADQGYELEVIVIDGISTDKTAEVAREMGAKVIFEKRRGYGRAYKTGFRAAKGDIIVTLDGDGTYPAELIADYVQLFNEKKLDFITVNRFSKMEKNTMLFSHRFGNRILSSVMCLLYSVKVKDSQSGMWIMSKRFIDKINLISDDFSFSEEIKIIAFKFFKAIELDGQYYRRVGKQKLVTFEDGWNNLKYLFRYKSFLNSSINSIPGVLEKDKA
jgi:glycosyltransferase involved in cell wall biosynthesis